MSAYDITIAGAGPAGSVLALLAARARYRVLLVEKSHFDRPRFGETAPPELPQALMRVGLERLAQLPFCPGASVSGVSRKRRYVLARRKCCRFGEATSRGHGTTSAHPAAPRCTSTAGRSTKPWPRRRETPAPI